MLYGHHASIERLFGLADVLNRYGTVTVPDLPGFGGMDSFYKIGEKPTLDNYADYLASLMKMYYKRRRVTVIAMSFSVPIVVRMMQKYPELAKRIDIFVSIAGFVHKDDFKFDRKTYVGLRLLSTVFSNRFTAIFMKKIILTRPVITTTYKMVSSRHSKMKNAETDTELNRRIDFEVGLWKMNDLRTRMVTMNMMFKMDVCDSKIAVPAYHITAAADRYFDNEVVKQHLHVIFDKLEVVETDMPNHAPSIMATAKEAAPYIPKRIRTVLN